MITLVKHVELEFLKKREKIQYYFWNIVGVEEHTSLPKLKHAIVKEFKNDDDRFVQSQIKLMQTEARVKIESRVKVWIKKPSINLL
jgi:hypothetical protein